MLADELAKADDPSTEQPPDASGALPTQQHPPNTDQPDPPDTSKSDTCEADPADTSKPNPPDTSKPDTSEADPADTSKPNPPDTNEPDTPATGELDTAVVDGERLQVYGDSAYGAGEVLATLENVNAEIMCKVQPPVAPGGRFAKDAFAIDLQAGTVTCPAGQIAILRALRDMRIARFGQACQGCPLAEQCTTSAAGRTIQVGPHEQQLTRARERQTDPAWKDDYKATRPKVERKIAHLMRRKHGGRRARVRGQTNVNADFALLAAAVNLARLATLGLTRQASGWATNTT